MRLCAHFIYHSPIKLTITLTFTPSPNSPQHPEDIQRQIRKQLIAEKLRARENRELTPSTVSLINRAKYLLIFFILAKVVWGILHQFHTRVKEIPPSNQNISDPSSEL